ncbi:uncharacterized protein [Mytilus edulis]|uniref:uncharacterized protein n=1 Tax=Mytilus edulis TaxID=6550 RepID=UPI0039EEBA16
MCRASFAIEQIGESKYGNENFDHVTLRASSQENNCTCLVFIENQSLETSQMYIQPYRELNSSAPKEAGCGMELYLDFYKMETLQPNQNMFPIGCTSGQTTRSLVFNKNSVLRFTSTVSTGILTTGYCIDIQRVHVNGQNGTLKIVCDEPGRIPLLNLPTTQYPDYPTGQPSSGSSSNKIKDESTLYIAVGGSAGGLLIIVVILLIIFYRRKFSAENIKNPETSKPDTTSTNEHDDPDYNGLKYNMLYVSADHQESLEGDYHTVDNNQESLHKNVSEHDINYSTVDDLASTSFNTIPTREENIHKGLGYEHLEGKELAKREQNISQEGNGNTYAVVDKRRITGHNYNKKAALSPVYAVVDKT